MKIDTKNAILDYYANHSSMTDPGSYCYMFERLPHNLEALCEIVRGLHMHYMEGSLYGLTIPPERLRLDEARTVNSMLSRICALDNQPLTVARTPRQRLVGCCRDFATMLCAMLRQQGIPARVRFGFGLYLNEDATNDHVVCEYWKADERRWVLVDAQQDTLHREMNHLNFDPHDIPYDQFILASDAWQQSRAGITDPNRFGYDSQLRGLWVIQQYLVHDLAALNKQEMLIGDNWGLATCGPEDQPEAEDLAFLDHVAAVIAAGDDKFYNLRSIYDQDERVQVPARITCYHLNNEREDNVSIAA